MKSESEVNKMNSTICIGFTLLMLVICLVVKNKKVATIGCGLVALIISMLTLYYESIYVDKMHLEGNPLSFIIVIINIILFVVLVIVNQKKDN